MRIEPYDNSQLDAVIRLSLRAWTPVFDSLQQVLELEVYSAFYPEGWRVSQQKASALTLRTSALKKAEMPVEKEQEEINSFLPQRSWLRITLLLIPAVQLLTQVLPKSYLTHH